MKSCPGDTVIYHLREIGIFPVLNLGGTAVKRPFRSNKDLKGRFCFINVKD
ncbi:hypothetical protein LEUCM_00863 [Leuconostoc suionicum]|nr:hypothetical protein LEUCM_00863 [Leuconostoc suionicum]